MQTFSLCKVSMFIVHGIENMKVTHQLWEEDYHRALSLEDFAVGGEILENLWKRGEKVDLKGYSKNNRWHEWEYKWERHGRIR